MEKVTLEDIKGKLYMPPKDSHKGQNGKLLIIGGSHLFHAASLWALQVASKIVDMVHYCSVEENNELVTRLKSEFRNGIVVPREEVEHYIEEDDCVLIGPGMVRADSKKFENGKLTLRKNSGQAIENFEQIINLKEEGVMTGALTNYLLKKYPQKQWVIDAGALQMVDPGVIPRNAILIPHHQEFVTLWTRAMVALQNFDPSPVSLVEGAFIYPSEKSYSQSGAGQNFESSPRGLIEAVKYLSKKTESIILAKGPIDIACLANEECKVIEGGNAGMTKGGTGDVLAGLIAALACKNDPYLSTIAGSYINKKAGDELFKTVGPYFNATDLAEQIPVTMKVLNKL